MVKKHWYKIVQNHLSSNEYEYARDYTSIKDAEADILEYKKEDAERGEYHFYSILNDVGEDIEDIEQEQFRSLAMSAMLDIGLTEDEAEMQLEDIGIY